MNTHYGPVEDLPFDLRMRRTITYTISLDATEKATERHQLASILASAIKDASKTITPPPPPTDTIDDAITAAEAAAPNSAALARKGMTKITTDLEAAAPPLFRNGATTDGHSTHRSPQYDASPASPKQSPA